MKLTLLFFFVLIAFNLSAGAQLDAARAPVFKIGTFDRSSGEFVVGAPKQLVNFIAGQSSSAKDWYATQPAASVATAYESGKANASAPRAITFSLDNVPAKVYRLRVALIQIASVPKLQITINGKQGQFYLHPKLDYSNGDQADSVYPEYSHAEIVFSFPGTYLHAGSNRITLQAIQSADDEVVPDAGLTYDAIELDGNGDVWPPETASALIEPTIFYPQGSGTPREIVDVFVSYREAMKFGRTVELSLEGEHYQATLGGIQDFGEQKVEFAVPEFPAHAQAKIIWNIAGQRQHKEQSIDPQRKWTLFLVPHIHVDVGFSDYQAKVAAVQSRVIDQAMDLTAQHPDFRFSMDGEWNLTQFMKTRTPAERQRVITAIQKKQLYMPADYANLLTGFPTAETLIRSLYPSANFSREYGTDVNYATISDVPSFSWSYASILASAGIHELFSGSNNYRAPVLLQGRLNESSPFWWKGPDGQKVLVWYSRHYMQMQVLLGQPPTLAAGRQTFPLFMEQYERPSYRADAVIIYGTQIENTDLFPQQAELAQQWNSHYAYPKLEYSGFHDALKSIAQQFGTNIPTVSGDGGPYWEDGIASDAYYAAVERQNESRGPSAEKLATLSQLVNPRLAADKAALDEMWTNMVLMDEHTWASYNSVTDPRSMEATKELEVKDSYAVQARAQADFISRNSMASLTDSISTGSGSLVVFNTLNWKRSGTITLDMNKGDEIVDVANAHTVPTEMIGGGSTFQRVRFVAQDVPAVGYKVFQLRPTDRPPASGPIDQSTTTLESPYYRLKLDPATGAVRSIYDKELKRELVNQESPYRFGQYLYVTGGDKTPNRLLQYSQVYPKAELQIHPASGGRLIGVARTPYGWVAHMESMDTNTPKIASEIRLFEHEKKIELVEDLGKNEVDTKEAVYFAFPFAMSKPQFQYEIQTGVVDPATNMYPGAGHEWFSVQHWVSVQQDGVSATIMPLDVPLITLGDINRGLWPTQFGSRPGNVFSYAMNNYWDTNYRAGQGGHFHFRYVFTSSRTTDAAELSHLGWQEATPLENNLVTSQDKALNLPRPLDGKQSSFLQTSDEHVLLEDWKPAEDGNGTILRFLDLGGMSREVSVQIPIMDLRQISQTDAVERNQKPLPLLGNHGFRFTIGPHAIVTVRIVGKGNISAPKINPDTRSAGQASMPN